MSNTESRSDRTALYVVSGTHAGATPVRLRLIGDFALLAPDGSAVPISNRRGCGLIVYLHFEPGHSASREKLAGLLWSDRGETQARANLRQCLRDLRSVLSGARLDLLDVGRQTISLWASGLSSDVDVLQRALAGSDPLAAAAALGDSRPLLDGLELGGLFDEWAQQTRARLEQSLRVGVREHLGRLEAASHWEGVVVVAEAYLHRDPLDEAVVAAAIRADAASGNAAAAHRRYRFLHEALARELGVAPGSAARDALDRIAPSAAKPGALGMRSPATEVQAPQTPLGPPLVVVSQFESTGSSQDTDRLATILRDEIVAGLSRFRDLRVITDPRPMDKISVDTFVQRPGDYLLGASLRGMGDASRLVVQLIRLETRHVVWSERLSVTRARMVETIDSTIAETVGAVLPTINSDLLRNPSNLPGHLVYQRYLAAREAAVAPPTFAAAEAAVGALEALVVELPDFALPYLPLAALYNTDFGYTRAGSSGAQERARALELARRALSLDRANANAYTAVGWSHLWLKQWGPAQLHFDRAIELNPFHASRVMEAGFGLLFLGDVERARALLNRCLLLNPSPEDGFFSDLGLLELICGNHEQAASHFALIAIPTVWASLYTALNAEALGLNITPAVGPMDRQIARIWPADTSPTLDALVTWIANHHPFYDKAMEDRFLGPTRRLLAERWRSSV